jgi:hypothetical protein
MKANNLPAEEEEEEEEEEEKSKVERLCVLITFLCNKTAVTTALGGTVCLAHSFRNYSMSW